MERNIFKCEVPLGETNENTLRKIASNFNYTATTENKIIPVHFMPKLNYRLEKTNGKLEVIFDQSEPQPEFEGKQYTLTGPFRNLDSLPFQQVIAAGNFEPFNPLQTLREVGRNTKQKRYVPVFSLE